MNLERLKELESKATPGPWDQKWIYGALRHISKNVDWDAFYSGPEEIETPDKDDAELIAEMRNQLPELLSTLTTTQSENKALVDEIVMLREALKSLAFKAEYMAKEMGRYTDLIPVKAQIEREINDARAVLGGVE